MFPAMLIIFPQFIISASAIKITELFGFMVRFILSPTSS